MTQMLEAPPVRTNPVRTDPVRTAPERVDHGDLRKQERERRIRADERSAHWYMVGMFLLGLYGVFWIVAFTNLHS